VRTVLLALTIVFSMFPVVVAGIPRDNEYIFAKVVLFVGDVPALLLAIIALPLMLGSLRARPRLRVPVAWAALIAVELIAFIVHASAEGVQTLLRLLTALAIIVTVATLRSPVERATVVGCLAGIAALQGILALAQIAHGGPLGLSWLGESPALMAGGRQGQLISPEGTMTHPHMLASLAVLTGTIVAAQVVRAWPAVPWSVAEAIALAPAGFTYARTALAGVGAAAIIYLRGAIASRPGYRVALLALVIGFGVPALIGLDGWGRKTDDVTFANGRDELTAQALLLIKADPLIGVGPGREMQALRALQARSPEQVTLLNAVHDVPLTVAIEAGIPGLAAVALLLVVAGYRALRGGGQSLAIFVGYMPFVLLDHFPYSYQHGLVLTAVWLGAIELFASRDAG
jgi:O-antigen ligase